MYVWCQLVVIGFSIEPEQKWPISGAFDAQFDYHLCVVKLRAGRPRRLQVQAGFDFRVGDAKERYHKDLSTVDWG